MNQSAHDPCAPLLLQALSQAIAPTLWVVDEHIAQPSRWLKGKLAPITIVTNRYDSYLDAHQAGITAHFNDIDLKAFSGQFNSLIYRISKEKAFVHQVINSSRDVLAEAGQLSLVGGKQEGIKTYIDKATQYVGPVISQENGDQSTRLATLLRSPLAAEENVLDDKDYRRLRPIAEENGLQFYSKPGQFGWDKLDQGSKFLIAHLDSFFKTRPPGNLLDLGCGYGYLALHASRYLPNRIVATDNNAAALLSCRFNLQHNDVANAQVVADDCGLHLQESFDTILCNPPFHQGFSTSGDMTDRFLEQTRRLMARSGEALFVVNQFIPLEQRAATRFRQVELIAKNKSFKLVRLANPIK